MTLYNPGEPVKLAPSALEDQTLKSNHHILDRVLKEDQAGEIKERDLDKSTPEAFFYWVKFHYASILLSEIHLVKV